MSNNSTTGLESKLTRLLEQYDARPDTNGVRFAFASPQRGWRWEWSSPGSLGQYFIASTTKLYVAALVMQLRAESQLELDAPAAKYLGHSVMAGIHVLRGVDASDRITIRELLSPLPSQEVRIAALIQVFFAGQLTDEQSLALFERLAADTRAALAVYDQIPQAAGTDDPAMGPPRERFFWQLTLDYGMMSARADLVWLENVLARLRAGELPPAPPAS